MKKINIFSLIAVILFMAGCDYNDEHFPGYDNNPIKDIAQYEGNYTGDYPADGYFTDKETLETAVDEMIKDILLYADKESTARINVLYGDITPGFSATEAAYVLTKADYDSMGEENGQPGRFDNFDANMDVDGYLTEFCAVKFASLPNNSIVNITYQFYESGSASARTSTYQKTPAGWVPVEIESFTVDISYTLETEDYDSMGETSGQPGRYDNFDANMDIDMYLSAFLRLKYPYTSAEQTAEVSYLYYANSVTTEQSRIYKYNGINWERFDPYSDTVEISTKIAEMEFNGTDWKLVRLLGGSMKYKFVPTDYQLLLDWVKVNQPKYLSTQYDNEEFYFGSSAFYNNINNQYSKWKDSYNINGEFTDKSNDEIQAIMDERMAWGIANVILPEVISEPDPGLSYQVTYYVYSGRGTGDYMMTFMYDEEEGEYELVSSVIKQ